MMSVPWALVGDIGGTNARFALAEWGIVRPQTIESLPCAGYGNLDDAVADYLDRAGVTDVSQACFAVASSLSGNRVCLTNNHWHFDKEELRARFGWDQLKVINDFTAMALGVLRVDARHCVPVCGGPGDDRRPRLVMGPGTGLGMSGLVPAGAGWVPLITEGGHVEFAAINDTEVAILRILQARYGHVSVERLLSGQGLLNLYQAHAGIQGLAAPLDEPEKITAAALEQGDDLAILTLNHFCEILGRVAGNAVLTLGSTGGVYLCGGILPRILAFFLDSPFRHAFVDKGRMRAFVERTPVYVITAPHTGVLGAAEALANPEI